MDVPDEMNCLQRSLVDAMNDPSLSCDQIKQRAFDSHPDCYVSSGFCELGLQSRYDVLRDIIALTLTYEMRDFRDQNALRQIVSTGMKCATNFDFMVRLFLVVVT